MLGEAIRYPLRGEGTVDTLLVGGGLHLLAVFVPAVPLVFVLGYLVVALGAEPLDREAVAPTETVNAAGPPRFGSHPPTLAGARRLLAAGVQATVVLLTYLAVPLAVLAAAATGLLAGAPAEQPSEYLVSAVGLLTLTAVAVGTYPVPAALVGLARERRVRAAFDVDLLRRAATSPTYFLAWAASTTLLAMAGALAGPLNRLALGFFVLFYAELVAVGLWRLAAPDFVDGRSAGSPA